MVEEAGYWKGGILPFSISSTITLVLLIVTAIYSSSKHRTIDLTHIALIMSAIVIGISVSKIDNGTIVLPILVGGCATMCTIGLANDASGRDPVYTDRKTVVFASIGASLVGLSGIVSIAKK